MKTNIIKVLVVILVILTLAVGGAVGYLWYVNNHVFVEDTAYPIDSLSLDLREEPISQAHYDELQAKLPDCEILWLVPFQGGHHSSDVQSLTLSSLTDADMDMLPYFPQLREIIADFDDYAVLEALQSRYPELTVRYTVDLGGMTVAPNETELSLAPGDYDYDALTENLKHIPTLTAVTLRTPELPMEQIEALKAAYPEIAFSFTVEILGQEHDDQTTPLDLSGLTADQLEQTAAKLSLLPGLNEIQLMDANGRSQLTVQEVKALQSAAPNAVFHYTFEFFGQTLSTATEEVRYANQRMGDESEAQLRAILDIMPHCRKIVLDNCHFSNEVLAKIREDYRGRTNVVWRVWFGQGSTLTDAEVIRAVYHLYNDNSKNLIYCEGARYIDFGHNDLLRTCEFVAGMPNLEVIIISGSLIADLTPFQNCKKLRILEAAFCEQITDVSPLAGCESLEMLNISNTHVTDLSPLDGLPLTHLVAKLNPVGGSRVPKEEQERFQTANPDCYAQFTGEQPYGRGWRYDNEDKPLPWYADIRKQFKYHLDPDIPNHVGWYLTTE